MTVKDKVRHILEHYPNTRNDDNSLEAWLMYTFYKEYTTTDQNGDLCVSYKNRQFVPKTWSIERARRKIQEGGEFLPTNPTVAKKRKLMCDYMRETLGDKS